MLIESLVKRDGPQIVTIQGWRYEFKPNRYGKLVAEVLSPFHVEFLTRNILGKIYYRPYKESRNVRKSLPARESS